MKKKLVSLLVGAFLVGAPAAFAAPLGSGVAYTVGQIITVSGQQYQIIPIPDTDNSGPALEILENNITETLRDAGDYVELNGIPGYQDGIDGLFGFNNFNNRPDYTVNAVPFDFGISAVLGAGALAAARTARSRRKKAEATA